MGFGPVGVEGYGAGAGIECVFGNEAGGGIRPVRSLRIGAPNPVIISVARNQVGGIRFQEVLLRIQSTVRKSFNEEHSVVIRRIHVHGFFASTR